MKKESKKNSSSRTLSDHEKVELKIIAVAWLIIMLLWASCTGGCASKSVLPDNLPSDSELSDETVRILDSFGRWSEPEWRAWERALGPTPVVRPKVLSSK